MKIKLSLQRPSGPEVDLLATVESVTTIENWPSTLSGAIRRSRLPGRRRNRAAVAGFP